MQVAFSSLNVNQLSVMLAQVGVIPVKDGSLLPGLDQEASVHPVVTVATASLPFI